MSEQFEARFVNQRLLRIAGVRKGILRLGGTLVITQHQLLFVPDDEAMLLALDRLCTAPDDDLFAGALAELVTRVAAHDHGVDVPRFHPALEAPDPDGRIRLLRIGQEDDLLVPPGDIALVQLVLGPPRLMALPSGPPAVDRLALLGGTTSLAYPETGPGGWIGPVSSGISALMTWAFLPALCLVALFVGDEIDDDLGAMLFLVGGGALLLGHLGTAVGTVLSFVRRERNRWWGLVAPVMLMVSSVVILAGSLIALDELF